MPNIDLVESYDEGKDCRNAFRAAYQNRYTWDTSFKGYKGMCELKKEGEAFGGAFTIGPDFKVDIQGIDNDYAKKSLSAQLWEVCIHRVRRDFNEVHGLNSFKFGDLNELGMEVIVGGKNKGDKYRIHGNVVTMVLRHIHGKLIQIYTKETLDTGKGYLSKSYTSQYLDPISEKVISPLSTFQDKFVPLNKNGPWLLSSREIRNDALEERNKIVEKYSFFDLQTI